MTWWTPGRHIIEVPPPDRLTALVALSGVRDAVDLALEHQDEWTDRAIWSMRLLQALRGAEEEIRFLREALADAAVDEGVSLRQVAQATGVTHATVRKWINGRAGDTPPSQDPSASDPPMWALDRERIRELGKRAGLTGIDIGEATEDWRGGTSPIPHTEGDIPLPNNE
ncbi:helix-turn-helix domain-containing protein [Isoptericola sp. NPDC019693]|uniref:helix-turn-helix domain-containing protein n=1 Tax=Isoptericola sp. NPDC019693 TaxID=3364009 RepID=UPI00379FC27E